MSELDVSISEPRFDPDALAHQLVTARQTRLPVPRPQTMSKAQATAVKRKAFALLSDDGRRPIAGYKVSKSYSWGAFTAEQVLSSPGRLSRELVFDPVVETEAVFLLDADIDPEATIEVILANSRVASGIEVADSRWRDWHPSEPSKWVIPNEAEIEADNALGSWMVVGRDSVPAASIPLPNVDVTAVRDGVTVACGSLSNVMGHPAQVVKWLAGALAEAGLKLSAGSFVSTGNPYRNFVTGKAGSTYESVINGVGKAVLTFY